MARSLLCLLPALLLAACQIERVDPEVEPAGDANVATALGRFERPPTAEDLDHGRRDTTWRGFVGADSAAAPAARRAAPALDSATVERYAQALRLPLSGDADSLAVAYAQVLLDRAGFSPGQIDGRWGQNTEKALFWLQRAEGLPATGTLDGETLARLAAMAEAPARPEQLIVAHALSAEDVEGPFAELPDDVYALAELDRLGYRDLAEKLGERFHASPDLLRQLNPGAPLDSMAAGDTLRAPAVRTGPPAGAAAVARLAVSDGGRYLHALDASGRIVYHFPASLGAAYDPSPSETLSITRIVAEPGWHYQPAILADVPDDEAEAHLPPGPNNPIGSVWIELSRPHYGIHGTDEPAAIGSASSAGCVRLTNWDARLLADVIEAGMQVRFRDVARQDTAPADTAQADTTQEV